MRWTGAAVRARLRAMQLIEDRIPASSHAFAEARLQLLTVIAAVDAGTITAAEATTRFDAISTRYAL